MGKQVSKKICYGFDKNYNGEWIPNIWNDIVSSAKRNEILGAIDYISPLPARILSDEMVALIPSVDKDGKLVSATVASVCQSGTEEIELLARNINGENIYLMGTQRERKTLQIAEKGNKEIIVKIPPLKPYEIVTVFFE